MFDCRIVFSFSKSVAHFSKIQRCSSYDWACEKNTFPENCVLRLTADRDRETAKMPLVEGTPVEKKMPCLFVMDQDFW